MGNTHEACVDCLKGIEATSCSSRRSSASWTSTTSARRSPLRAGDRHRPVAVRLLRAAASRFEELDPGRHLKDDPELKAKYEAGHGRRRGASDVRQRQARPRAVLQRQGQLHRLPRRRNLTDEKYHNLGVGMDKEKPDLGRAEVTKDEKDNGAFKTPTIRNVAQSAPYMHDGSQKTLEEVVEWYAKGGHPNPYLSDKIKKLDLTDQDKKRPGRVHEERCTGDFPKVEPRGRLPE